MAVFFLIRIGMINFAIRFCGFIIDDKNMSKKTNRDNDEFYVETGDDRISMIAEISTTDDS